MSKFEKLVLRALAMLLRIHIMRGHDPEGTARAATRMHDDLIREVGSD